MSTYFGTEGNDTWTIQWAAIITIDGLGGVDTLRLGTSKRTDYRIMQAEDGAILVESVSRASSPFKGTLYNIEKLVFDSGRDVMELTAGGGLNKVQGDGVNALITGTDAADHLLGTALAERLIGGLGNDLIDGGAGLDTAVYLKPAENYALGWTKASGWKVTFDGPVAAVVPPLPTDGTDTLINVERLEFSDRVISIESTSPGSYAALPDALYHFFVVAFGAPPGVTYMNQLADAYRAGVSVKQIVDIFITKPQFTDVYPQGLSDRELSQRLVENVIGGSAAATVKAEAVEDLVAAFGSGMTRSDVVYTVFGNLANMPTSDLKYGGTAKLFSNQLAVSKTYTEVMMQGTTELATLRSVLDSVTSASNVSTEEARISLVLSGLMGGLPASPLGAASLTREANEAQTDAPREHFFEIESLIEKSLTWHQFAVDF